MAHRVSSLLALRAPLRVRHTLRANECVFFNKNTLKISTFFFFCLQTSTFDRFAAVRRKMERPVCFCFCRTSMIIFFLFNNLLPHCGRIRHWCAHPLTIAQHSQRCLLTAACTVATALTLQHRSAVRFAIRLLHTHSQTHGRKCELSPHCIRHQTHSVYVEKKKKKELFWPC